MSNRQRNSRRVFIWRDSEARFYPSYITKIDRFWAKGILVCGGIMLGSRTSQHVFDSSTGSIYQFFWVLWARTTFLWMELRTHNVDELH
ncbi:hypothetical protein TNCV_2998181 [Trichonephila clavipes]|nr:hypothetical protein TNCV_2998181 [Trichonephila clavipes]